MLIPARSCVVKISTGSPSSHSIFKSNHPNQHTSHRLRHEQTLQELRGTAAYQRKILVAGVAALKPGGALVFSTCTISHLENEGNVRWLLDSCPHLRLVPAEPRIAGPGLQGLLTAEEASLVQRFDPGVQPAQEQGTHALDSIGFFIAKFVKAG